MLARSGYLRTALAVLALLGQLTPAVAVPAVSAANVLPKKPSGDCAAATCACSALDRAASACCCSGPKPKPAPQPKKAKKASCCEKAVEPDEPVAGEPKAVPRPTEPAAKLVSGGKCKCDRPTAAVTAEPAVPHAHTDAITFDASSAPGPDRRAVFVAIDPLPPPAPPPRA